MVVPNRGRCISVTYFCVETALAQKLLLGYSLVGEECHRGVQTLVTISSITTEVNQGCQFSSSEQHEVHRQDVSPLTALSH